MSSSGQLADALLLLNVQTATAATSGWESSGPCKKMRCQTVNRQDLGHSD
jgi:hypothetical protein